MIYLVNNSCYFEIVIYALAECFQELSIPHQIVKNIDYNSNNLYLVCTAHQNDRLPKRYISYNFEQLITDKVWSNNFFDKLKGAVQVWDYSLENIKELNKYNIDAIHLPLGYTKSMEKIMNIKDKTVDVFFVGCINNYRYEKLDNLIKIYKKQPNRLVISNSSWGDNLINLYEKSKIGLNLHYYQGRTILEIHRIIPLIANKILVISEESDDKWYDINYKEIIDFMDISTTNMIKLIIKNLSYDEKKYKELIEYRYNYLKNNLNMLGYIQERLNLLTLI